MSLTTTILIAWLASSITFCAGCAFGMAVDLGGGEVKRCTQCGTSKPRSEFSPNRYNSDGLQTYCKECARQMQRDRRLHPEEREYVRRYNRARHHALRTLALRHPDEFKELLKAHRLQQETA